MRLDSLPLDIEAIYAELEEKCPIGLSADVRLMYYSEFTRRALGSTTLHFREVEVLIQKKNPEIMISKIEFLTLLTSTFLELSKGAKEESEPSEYIDFKHFATLIYHLIRNHTNTTTSTGGIWTLKYALEILPLDPDSTPKQAWDTVCMILLLYCSFSVPFSIAFDEVDVNQGLSQKEKFESVIDAVFMTDILLNFITAWDNQGFVVREFGSIARNYLRTWFAADFAGSFPFDKAIAAFVDADAPSVASMTLFRGLRLIKMLKLVRATTTTTTLILAL
jgi:hypothetical protein